MDAEIETTVVDARKVGPELVWEATQAALDDARTKAPEATLENLLHGISPHVIYNYWMPRKFNKKGCYQQVAGLFKQVREQILSAEQLEQTGRIPIKTLSLELTTELNRVTQQLTEGVNRSVASLEITIAANNETIRDEVLRYADAKQQAEDAKHQRMIRIIEKESMDHLAAAAVFERERDVAIGKVEELTNRVEELTAQMAAADEKCHSFERVVNSLSDQLRDGCQRADSAFTKMDEASLVIADLREQLTITSRRVFEAEAETGVARNEAARLTGLLTEIKDQLAAAHGQVDILTQQLHIQSARADRELAKGGRQHCHSYPSRAVYVSRRKSRSD
ncbi:hypothetical protein [Geomonas azotofigens]|uniref:hypothetical protein n=1 Tax=Geomonas azotofigens TaxID=2843196 RepID=UPI001C1137D3|nr:hypothetical protein [Geomonas azotofigens]MBU5613917.1 hypothetical protein [Geomonas azotofigens]